jgi:hypothetical protein
MRDFRFERRIINPSPLQSISLWVPSGNPDADSIRLRRVSYDQPLEINLMRR